MNSKHIDRRGFLKLTAAAAAAAIPSMSSAAHKTDGKDRPNILLIYADDLGYGDVGCYNPCSKVPTSNLDRLAKEGMLFTDAHSPATVCTPSRYGLLTGRLAFRTGRRGVFVGVGGPSMIKKDRLTLPNMLKKSGYTTATFGKWHLGMTFFDDEGNRLQRSGVKAVRKVDYSRRIPDGPLDRGFDEFFGTACCPTTDWLYAYIDGDRIPVPPTKLLDRSKLPGHYYSLDCRRGMVAPNFDHEQVDMVFLRKSLNFLEKHAKNTPDKPFFLLHSTQAVHLPSFPADKFKGKTDAGPHGDFIFELDYIVGQLLKALDRHGFAQNTIVMVASDNGPELPTVKAMRHDYQHDGAHPWRGLKRDDWEGGHRVPFIVRWPDKVKAGSVTHQTVSFTDIMATCATVVDYGLPDNAAEDSYDILPVLLGEQSEDKAIRPYTLQQARRGFSIRSGKWKYLDHKGSGGNNYDRDGEWGAKEFALEQTAPGAPGQLYNLEKDPGETTNLYFEHPEIVRELEAKLDKFIESGRSAPTRKR